MPRAIVKTLADLEAEAAPEAPKPEFWATRLPIGLVAIQAKSGPLPVTLAGRFTTMDRANKAIAHYLTERGDAKIEKKDFLAKLSESMETIDDRKGSRRVEGSKRTPDQDNG